MGISEVIIIRFTNDPMPQLDNILTGNSCVEFISLERNPKCSLLKPKDGQLSLKLLLVDHGGQSVASTGALGLDVSEF